MDLVRVYAVRWDSGGTEPASYYIFFSMEMEMVQDISAIKTLLKKDSTPQSYIVRKLRRRISVFKVLNWKWLVVEDTSMAFLLLVAAILDKLKFEEEQESYSARRRPSEQVDVHT